MFGCSLELKVQQDQEYTAIMNTDVLHNKVSMYFGALRILYDIAWAPGHNFLLLFLSWDFCLRETADQKLL